VTPPLPLAHLYEVARRTGEPLVGGHRGNPAEHPENTLASFRSAVELGVDIIECDVHLSADGHMVVIHDHTVDRTTDGAGMVRELTWDELQRLDAGKGERIPSLEAVIDVARGAGVGLAIEIKQIPIPYPRMEELVVTALREAGMVERACVISFYHPSCKLAKEIEPALVVGLLEGARPIDPVRLMLEADSDVYCPHYGAMDPALVQELHAADKGVGVWTVDDAAAIAWCQFCKPDSIFTNRPREILPQLRG
jgi:glycerophosphoryl diester phosphodiesterase